MQTIEQKTDTLVNPLKSCIITGKVGSGKTTLINQAIQEVRTKHPEIKVYNLSPEFVKESLGFDGQDYVDYLANTLWGSAGIENTLYVFDELKTVYHVLTQKSDSTLYNSLLMFIMRIASSGNAMNRYVWLSVHTKYGIFQELKLSKGNLNTFTHVVLFDVPE